MFRENIDIHTLFAYTLFNASVLLAGAICAANTVCLSDISERGGLALCLRIKPHIPASSSPPKSADLVSVPLFSLRTVY